MAERIDIDQPRWDQSTFFGRLSHFANITDPRAAFVSAKELMEAKNLVESYRQNQEPPGTTMDQVYRAQKLCQSAFHPDTGELQNVFGRMSFQVPGGTVLIAAMITWYKSTAAVVFWQWANQSFNALVNYTNRNAKSSISTGQLAFAYCTATSAAVGTALGLKSFLAKRGGSFVQRFVPLAAVYAAQCVNVPLMRQSEIQDGLILLDDKNEDVGKSRLAAVKAIGLVVLSRNVMATPSMLLTPIFMSKFEQMRWYQKRQRFLNVPFQVFYSAMFLLFMVPAACAIFPQKNYIATKTLEKLEPGALKSIKEANADGHLPDYLYFNKGL